MAKKALAGATIVKEELNNEAGRKLGEMKKASKFDEFIAITKKAEEENVKPLSGDYEVVENVSDKELKKFGEEKRMIGWEPGTKTALVLKLSFLEKKKKKLKEEE